MGRLDGKVALVSGAGRGIGAEIARTLAREGAKVVITDVLAEEGAAVVVEIEQSGGEAAFFTHDVTKETEWQQAVALAQEKFGGLNVLVNNAGVYMRRTIEEMTLDEWRWISAVNLEGVFLGTKYAIGAMKETNPSVGSIINMSSVAAITGSPLSTAYGMSKGGVRSFTRATALECANLGYNIRANSIHPGVIDTDMGDAAMRKLIDVGGMGANDARQYAIDLHPIGRLGQPRDIANMALFLASDESDFITGAEMVVDGGMTAR